MKHNVFTIGFVFGATSIWASAALAQGQPHFKLWATDIYDSTLSIKPCPECPTQDIPSGRAEPGDFINIEVTVEGWDLDPDQGLCDGAIGVLCSVSAQDCAQGVCIPHPLVAAFSWKIDSSTFELPGGQPGLLPARIPCTADADCMCAYDSACSAASCT